MGKADACKARMAEFISTKKLTAHMDALFPGEDFLAKHKLWQTVAKNWQNKVSVYKAALQARITEKLRKVEEKAARVKRKELMKQHKEKLKEATKAKRLLAAQKAAAEGSEPPADEPEVISEPEVEEVEDEEVEEEAVEVDFDAMDVFGVDDVADIGDKRPLSWSFGIDDWTMMNLRVDLHLLLCAFKK